MTGRAFFDVTAALNIELLNVTETTSQLGSTDVRYIPFLDPVATVTNYSAFEPVNL